MRAHRQKHVLRQRLLSPELFMNAELGALPMVCTIFFAGLWCHSDFNGVFLWEPGRLALAIIPYDKVSDPNEVMDLLEGAGSIKSFEAGGKRYGYIPSWTKWQKPHMTERPFHPKPLDPDFVIRVKPTAGRVQGDNCYGEESIPGDLYTQAKITQMRLSALDETHSTVTAPLEHRYSSANQYKSTASDPQKALCQEAAEIKGQEPKPEELFLAKALLVGTRTPHASENPTPLGGSHTPLVKAKTLLARTLTRVSA
jgi:hypothetical protein